MPAGTLARCVWREGHRSPANKVLLRLMMRTTTNAALPRLLLALMLGGECVMLWECVCGGGTAWVATVGAGKGHTQQLSRRSFSATAAAFLALCARTQLLPSSEHCTGAPGVSFYDVDSLWLLHPQQPEHNASRRRAFIIHAHLSASVSHHCARPAPAAAAGLQRMTLLIPAG